MSGRISSTSRTPKTYRCHTLAVAHDPHFGVAARHRGIAGFEQAALTRAVVLLIGAGGLGGEIGEGLVRKGVGELHIFDGDTVEASNLNRQRFTAADLGKNKALCLARNLQLEGYLGTVITGYPQDCMREEG